MKKFFSSLLVFLLGTSTLFGYQVADSIVIKIDRVLVYKKAWIPSYTVTVKTATFAGTFMGPVPGVGMSIFTYCRNPYNGVCNMILSYGVLIDTIPIVFAGHPGIRLVDMAKAVQPCNAPDITLAHFRSEGGNFALPGEEVNVQIYTGGNITNVFYNIKIVEALNGVAVTNTLTSSAPYGNGTMQNCTFTLSDTIEENVEYAVVAYVNCGNLPPIPNVYLVMSLDIFKISPGTVFNFDQCVYHTVILLQPPPLALPQDTTTFSPVFENNSDTLENIIVYPNPTDGPLNYMFYGQNIILSDDFQVKLFNLEGIETPCRCKTTLPPDLPQAIYSLRIVQNGKLRAIKIIKK